MEASTAPFVTKDDSAPFNPASTAPTGVSFDPSARPCISATAATPINPFADGYSTSFNPAGMPYFSPFPAYTQHANFPYFPAGTVPQWRPVDSSFSGSLPPSYPTNTVLTYPPSSFPGGVKKRKARKLYSQAQASGPLKKSELVKMLQYLHRILQIDILVREFRKHGYVSKEDRVRIGQMTGIPEDKVKIWYQNRRYKEKHTDGSTSSEERRSQSPSEEETKPSPKIPGYFPTPQTAEATWLPDLSAPSAPQFTSIYPAQAFTFFPPPSGYHPFTMAPPPPQSYQAVSRTHFSSDSDHNPAKSL